MSCCCNWGEEPSDGCLVAHKYPDGICLWVPGRPLSGIPVIARILGGARGFAVMALTLKGPGEERGRRLRYELANVGKLVCSTAVLRVNKAAD